MTTHQFHKGQNVDVAVRVKAPGGPVTYWHEATIVECQCGTIDYCLVELPSGSRGVFKADHIRPARTGCVTTAAGEEKFL